mgnify:CR=1 FL=1
MSIEGSSIKKGETLLDTAMTLNALHPDVLVLRHRDSGASALLAKKMDCAVVNAGDGSHEHPTQALLDALTIRRRRGDLDGQVIAICGDILHSRVARSNLHAVTACGGDVILVGPEAMVPPEIAQIPVDRAGSVTILHDLDAALESADVVMMLRVQFEREATVGEDYRERFGLTEQRFSNFRGAIMHPGPMNRGIEIDDRVANIDSSPHNLILSQVTSGVATRMAILEHLVG